MNNYNPFWMIYVEGGNAPTYKHTNYESAVAEAKRLAEGADFTVSDHIPVVLELP